MTGKNVGDDPAGDVGGPAGGKRHDDRHRPRGIVLGLRTVQSRQHQKNSRRRQMLCHVSPPQLHYCSCSRDHKPVSLAGKLGWRRRRHEGAVCSLCFDDVASGAPYQSTQQLMRSGPAARRAPGSRRRTRRGEARSRRRSRAAPGNPRGGEYGAGRSCARRRDRYRPAAGRRRSRPAARRRRCSGWDSGRRRKSRRDDRR